MACSEKKQNRKGPRLLLVVLMMSMILGYNARSYSATELEEVNEQIIKNMAEVVDAKKNCDEVCASIAVESGKFFLANSANEILSIIVIRMIYEMDFFETMEYIGDAHKKTVYPKRVKDYSKVRDIIYKEMKQFQELKANINDENLLFYFDEAEEAIAKAMDSFDKRAYLLKSGK